MEYLESYADTRLIGACIHCGAETETRDHCPSRVLLDEPYPENLPVVPACAACNGSFSLDEEYFACQIECVRTGSVEFAQRPKIRRILNESPALAARLSQATMLSSEGLTTFAVENNRIKRVVMKLARGHAAYELSETHRGDPAHLMIRPLHLLAPETRQHFETPPSVSICPEIGSRAMQRMVVGGHAAFCPGWIEVQEGLYRYLAVAETAIMIRFVASEYLACEVIWGEDD